MIGTQIPALDRCCAKAGRNGGVPSAEIVLRALHKDYDDRATGRSVAAIHDLDLTVDLGNSSA